jgi:hypothetical protein
MHANARREDNATVTEYFNRVLDMGEERTSDTNKKIEACVHTYVYVHMNTHTQVHTDDTCI